MVSTLSMFGLGGWEMGVVAFIALLVFGKNLPKVARGLGEGVVEFKRGLQGLQDEVDDLDPRKDLPNLTDLEAETPELKLERQDHAEA